MLNLVESFYSIQGEGKYCGRPAVFFRFAGCNLRCKGFGVFVRSSITNELLQGCDTIRATYTSDFTYQQIYNKDELLKVLFDYKLPKKPIIVITGGEPLIHHKNEIFYDFVKTLVDDNYSVHFETNGTILVDFDKFSAYKSCIFCISPKLINSAEPKNKRLNPLALKTIKKNAKEFFYKFVVCKPSLSEKESQKEQINEIISIADGEVFCMPLGKNQEELSVNALYCLEFCLEMGYNYTDRLHIRIFNDKEGV